MVIPHWEWYFEGLALHFDDQPVVFRFWVFSFFFFKYRWILLGRGFPLRRPRGSSSQQRALMCRETDWTQTPIGEIHVGGDSAASTHPYHRLRRRIRDSIGTASPSPSCRWWRAWASSWPCGRPKKKTSKRISLFDCGLSQQPHGEWLVISISLQFNSCTQKPEPCSLRFNSTFLHSQCRLNVRHHFDFSSVG